MRYPNTCTAVCLFLALALALAPPLHAAPAATQEAGEDAVNDGTSKQEIARHLQEIEKRFGKDAVAMQGSLLGEASRNGSIYDAEISITGVEERGGKRFLAFRLQTGIVYNDRDTSPLARRQNAWGSIVEKTLRQFRTLTVPADGVAIVLAYHHTTFSDAATLREEQAAAPGEAETLAFYVLAADVAELTAERITSQQLLDRSTLLLDGAPFHLVPAPPAATPAPGGD